MIDFSETNFKFPSSSTKQFSHDSRTGMEFLILMSLSVATLRRVKCVVSNLDVKQSYALIVFNDTKFISLSPTEPSIIIVIIISAAVF